MVLTLVVNSSELVSPHFRRRELACRCCGTCLVDPWLLITLELLRARIARPLTISSGFRCPDHNRAIGGSPQSQHLAGRAADVQAPGLNSLQLAMAAEQIPYLARGALGLYSDSPHLHLDVRGHRVRFAFDGGKPVDYHALLNDVEHRP